MKKAKLSEEIKSSLLKLQIEHKGQEQDLGKIYF